MKRFNQDIDMNVCYVTGMSGHIERHHIYGASNRTRSTFYGYVVPLLAPLHVNGARASDKECKKLTGMTLKQLDKKLKQSGQKFYEEELGKSRAQWIKEFGKNYL